MDIKRCKLERGHVSIKKVSGHINPSKQWPYYEAKSNEETGDWISQLPADILSDILCRIPFETIFSCRCVSKILLNVSSSSQFTKTCHTKLPDNEACSIIYRSRVFLLSLDSIQDLEIDRDCDRHLMQIAAKQRGIPRPHNHLCSVLLGSINGLLCVRYEAPNAPHISSLYICDPIVGDFKLLPRPRLSASRWNAAFGFCPRSREYKVIRFVNSTYAEIHTVGTDYWKIIYNVPYVPNPCSWAPCCLNGNILWITYLSKFSELICSINLESELWEFISMPPQINEDTVRRLCCMSVGALGGLFCFCYVHVDIQVFEVCVMKEFGVKESWSKELSIDLKGTLRGNPRKMFMLQMRVLNNGELSYDLDCVDYHKYGKGTYKGIAPWGACHVPHISNYDVGEENVRGTLEAITIHWSLPEWVIKFLRHHYALTFGLPRVNL